MTNIYFKCANCGKSLAIDDADVNETVNCPDCNHQITVPSPVIRWDCIKCGSKMSVPKELAGESVNCVDCSAHTIVPSKKLSLKIQQEEKRNCPHCGGLMGVDAVVCINCGFNFKTGEKIKAARQHGSADSFPLKPIIILAAILMALVVAWWFIPDNFQTDLRHKYASLKESFSTQREAYKKPATQEEEEEEEVPDQFNYQSRDTDDIAGSQTEKPEIISETKPEPPAEKTPVQLEEDVVEQARECVKLQSKIFVPHELKDFVTAKSQHFENASVIRVEPDGIHISHATGIEKINYEMMTLEGQERYHIDPVVAETYREVINQRNNLTRKAKASAIAEAESQRQQLRKDHASDLEQIKRERKIKKEEQKRNSAIQAWRKYDSDMARYHEDIRHYEWKRENDQRYNRVSISRKPSMPTPPTYPRP